MPRRTRASRSLAARSPPAPRLFGDEHGRISARPEDRPELGARIELVTPHCDPTVNLHDIIHVVDGDRPVDIWPIDARGH